MKSRWKFTTMLSIAMTLILSFTLMLSPVEVSAASATRKPAVKASQTVISMGKTTQVRATYAKKNVTTKVSWKSSNKKVATINKKGVVTAKSCGTSYITAKYKGATSSRIKITVTSTKLNKTSVKLAGSKTYKLTAKYNKKNVKPSYKSSNAYIATVNKDGKITALKKGTATITASYKGSTAKCKVTVTSTPLAINKPTKSLTVGSTYKLNAKYNKKTVKPTYKTNNKNIAVIDKNGKITAVAKGNAVITVSYKGTIITCGVTVVDKPHTHNYTATVTPATCTKDGVKTFTCSCGAKYTEAIKAIGHKFDNGVITAKPTCDKDGVKIFTCTKCGAKYGESIKAIGHKYTMTQTAPTCDKNGAKIFTCSNCGAKYSEVINATGHSFDNGKITVQPTCDKAGVKTFTCTKCGKTRTEAIKATNHSFNNGVITAKPTCDKNGVKTFTCTKCHKTYTEAVKAIGHKYNMTQTAPTCDKNGAKTYTCSNCGAKYSEVIKATGHNYDNGKITVKPTCEKAGVKTFTCSKCHKTYTEVVKATGHSFNGGVITAKPTCDKAGVKTFTCTKCGKTRTEAVVAIGHKWTEKVVKTIDHKEEGHYKTVIVEPAYDEPIYEEAYVCGGCRKVFKVSEYGSDTAAVEAWAIHSWAAIDAGNYKCQNYHVENVQVGTKHHDAVTKQEWVVDKPAWTEQIKEIICTICGHKK